MMINNVQKHIKTELLPTYIKLAILNGLLLLIFLVRSFRLQDVSYKIIPTIHNLNFMGERLLERCYALLQFQVVPNV
jgi:hypothetical protein